MLEGLNTGVDLGVLDQERLCRVCIIQQHQHELVPQDGELSVGLLSRLALLGLSLRVLNEHIGEGIGAQLAQLGEAFVGVFPLGGEDLRPGL